MGGQTPLETVEMLTAAINKGDVEGALSMYEPTGVLVPEPGSVASGTEAIRRSLQGFISLNPNLTVHSCEVIDSGDIVLYCSNWTLKGTAPDGSPVEMGGTSSDVLRRQSDGSWLIAIDNPWGGAILG